MKKILLIFVIITFTLQVNAQNPQGAQRSKGGEKGKSKGPVIGYGKISGKIVDAANGDPVAFATVALIDMTNDKTIDGNVADDNGKFVMKSIPAGTFKVTITFIGYETIEKTDLVITDKGNDIHLGNIRLSYGTKQLDEVVVSSQRDLIEEKVDRTIYNAEKDQTTKGGDAVDVLRRVPLLSVDLDGNVSLRGSQNIKVLIDNRPSTITAGSIADALKQIPADQIKSVEVITSPSARYDAEGTGGIINIITKKNNLQGASLSINSSAGLRGSNLGLNASLRKGRTGFSLGGFGRLGYNIKGSFTNEQTLNNDDGSTTQIDQAADTENNLLFGRYNFGWDYEINKYNWVTASARFGIFNFKSDQNGLTTNTFENTSLINSSLQDVNFDNLSNNLDASFNYIRTYEKPRKELSFIGMYSVNNRTNDFENEFLDETTNAIVNRFKNDNDSDNQEFTLQMDYVSPINEKQTLEFGGKHIKRMVKSNFQSSFALGNDPYEVRTGDELTNVFDYEQDVTAGYISYTLGFLEKYTLKVGGRYEYTDISANFLDEQNLEIPSYGVLVPSINISKKLKNGNTIKAAYNKRIQRPSLQFLNPNIQAANPKNISQGNPNLDPEFTDNFEFSYSTYIKGSSLNFSGYMRNTNGSIQRVREILGQDTVYTSFQNIGEEDAYGLSLFANINVNKKLMLNGGIDGYYAVLSNNVPNPLYNAKNEGFVISGRVFGSYKFTEQWAFQVFAFTRGRRVQLQGYQSGFYIYSLSLQRSFKNKRGSIGFGAENFFQKEMRMRNEIISPLISQSGTNFMRNTSFKINLSYRIGKLDANPRPRRRAKRVNNDDLKGGGGDNQNGGQQ